MTANFDNVNRNRYYGLRIGDIVKVDFFRVRKEDDDDDVAEIIGYGAMDNNRVYIRILKTGEETSTVAEWCNIITKVEDK